MATPPKLTGNQTDKKDESWLNHAQALLQKAPERLEDTAKFLVGIISIVLSLFITKRPDGIAEAAHTWLILAAVAFCGIGVCGLCFCSGILMC